MRPCFWSTFLIAMGLLIGEAYSSDDDGHFYKNVLHATKKLPVSTNVNNERKRKETSSVHDKISRENVSTSTYSAIINVTSLESVGYATKFNRAESSRSKRHFHRSKMSRKDSHVRSLDDTLSHLRADATLDHPQKKLNSAVESFTFSSHLLQSQISITRHVTERDKLDLTSSSSVVPFSQMVSFSRIKARTLSPAENVRPIFISDTSHIGANSILSSESMKHMALKAHNQWSTSSSEMINSSYTNFIRNGHVRDSVRSGNNVTLYNDAANETAENVRSSYPLHLSTGFTKSTQTLENDMYRKEISSNVSNDSNVHGGINCGKIGMSWTSVENVSNKASTIDAIIALKNIDLQENWSAVLKSDEILLPEQDPQGMVSSIAKESSITNATDRNVTYTIKTKMFKKNPSQIIVEVPLKVNVPSRQTSSETSQKFSSSENYKAHLSTSDQTLSLAKCLYPRGFSNNEQTIHSSEKNMPFFKKANSEISLSVPPRSMRTEGCFMRNVVKLHSKVSNDPENHDVYLQDQSSSFATPLNIDDKVERGTCSVELKCEPSIEERMKSESRRSSIQRNLTAKSELSTNDSEIINELVLVPYISTTDATVQRVTSEKVVKETNTTTRTSPSILNFHEEIFAISDKSSTEERSKKAIRFDKNSTTEDTIYVIEGLGYFKDNLDDIAEFEDVERREEPVFDYGENGNDPILLQVDKHNSLKLPETETLLEQSISMAQLPWERNFIDHYDKSWWSDEDVEVGKILEDKTLDINSKDEVKKKVKKGSREFFIGVLTEDTKYPSTSEPSEFSQTVLLPTSYVTMMMCIIMAVLGIWYKRITIIKKSSLSKLWQFFPKKRRTMEAV